MQNMPAAEFSYREVLNRRWAAGLPAIGPNNILLRVTAAMADGDLKSTVTAIAVC